MHLMELKASPLSKVMAKNKVKAKNKGKQIVREEGNADYDLRCSVDKCSLIYAKKETLCKHVAKKHGGSSMCPDCLEVFLSPKQEKDHSHLGHGAAVDPILLWKGKVHKEQKAKSHSEIRCPVKPCQAMCSDAKYLCTHVGKKHPGSTMCPDCLAVFCSTDDILKHAHYGHKAAVDPIILGASM